MMMVNMQNICMDYVYFILAFLVLVAAFIFLVRIDRKSKNNYKATAYELLETSSPNPKHVKDCVRGLRLYGGHMKKDKEAHDLVRQLIDKHGQFLK